MLLNFINTDMTIKHVGYMAYMEYQFRKFTDTVKRPRGMTMRQWWKGPGSKFMSKPPMGSINHLSRGKNFSNGFFGIKVSHWCNTPNGPPHTAFAL